MMQKTLLFFVSVLFAGISIAQENVNAYLKQSCAQFHTVNSHFKAKPNLSQKRNEHRLALDKWTTYYKINEEEIDTINLLTIPVVFHIVHQNGPENVNDDQVLSALEVLNEDFSNRNPNIGSIAPQFENITADLGLRFVLATRDPSGEETTGINRYFDTKNIMGDDPQMKKDYGWPNDEYLNIYVVRRDKKGAASGYAFYPSDVVEEPHLDGLVVAYWAFGKIGTARWTHYSLISHEIGHWANLKHTWGGDASQGSPEACADDDGVDDTPNCNGYWGGDKDGIGVEGCLKTRKSCGSIDMIQNHMDYSYCPIAFTKGQKEVVRAAMLSSIGGRSNLWQEDNLKKTGCISGIQKPVASISFSTVACEKSTIQFKDKSLYFPTEWKWEFIGGTPSKSTETNPLVVYKKEGIYSVKLTVKNKRGESTKVVDSLIRVDGSKSKSYPFFEGFENEIFPPINWQLSSKDSIQWERKTAVGGFDLSYAAASIDNTNLDYRGYRDGLWSPSIDLSEAASPSLSFDLAFSRNPSTYYVSLKISYSTDCGQTWNQLYNKGGEQLATAKIFKEEDWEPSKFEWRTEAIDLIKLKGKERVMFQFENLSGVGNNVFIDNIRIADAPPFPFIKTPKTSIICEGETLTFEAGAVGSPDRYEWNFEGGTPANSKKRKVEITYEKSGIYEVQLSAKNSKGKNQIFKKGYITVRKTENLPIKEYFDREFPPKYWSVINPDGLLSWEQTDLAGGFDQSQFCMLMNNADNKRVGEKDEIITTKYDFSAGTNISFSFDLAYVKFDSVSIDRLKIYSSSNCGQSWQVLYNKAQDELATSTSEKPNSWIPSANEWRKEIIDVSELSGKKGVQFKFENINGFGAKIWIDNVKIRVN